MIGGKVRVKVFLDQSNGNNRLVETMLHAPSYNSTMVWIGEDMFQLIAPNTSPSRFMGTCQQTELGAFQYETVLMSPDRQYFHLANGGQFQRVSEYNGS